MNRAETLFVVAVLAILAVVFVPVPAPALDALLVASFVLSLLTLLTVMSLREPSEFTIFPSLLLLATAFRLSLNIATTRSILTNAPAEGTEAAGEVIGAFGSFVTGNEPAVGVVIFLLLTIVNFVVITKGAGRVSEVSARFTLDALPGKQMAVDGELAAGGIDDAEARRRREKIGAESSFYGAMDGAMKFVRGDAVAGLLITLVNIAGGLAIGIVKHGMPLGDALGTFTVLTIGDGLVSQVPALLVSIAAGLLVTRATSPAGMGAQLWGQIATRRVMLTAAGFLAAVAALAATQSVWLGLEVAAAAAILWVAAPRERRGEEPATAPPSPAPTELESLWRVEPLELAVGGRFVAALAPGGVLARGIEDLRRDLAGELGILLPSVRARDEVGRLRSREYAVKVRGVRVGGGTAEAPQAVLNGVKELLVRHAPEVVGQEDVRRLVEMLRASNPALVERCLGGEGPVALPALHAVVRNLLAERVPVRDLSSIVEAMAAAPGGDVEEWTRRARKALGRAIVEPLLGPDGALRVVPVDVELEDELRRGKGATESLLRGLASPAALLSSPDAREAVFRWVEAAGRGADVTVLSRDEIPRGVRVEAAGSPLRKPRPGID
jgi:flagellar biosynthesis protein FlhA